MEEHPSREHLLSSAAPIMPSTPQRGTRIRWPLVLAFVGWVILLPLVLVAGAVLLKLVGRACGIHWLAAADREMLKLLSTLLFLLPFYYVSSRLFERHKERLLGAEVVAARAARERAMAAERAEEASGFRWSVPVQVELRRLPKSLALIACFYVGTLLLVAAILGTAKLVSYLFHNPMNESVFAVAVTCANVVGGCMLSLLAVLLAVVRVQVTLGADGIIERLGSVRHAYPYRKMSRCRIEPSPRVPSLRCLAFTCDEDRPAAMWHRFEFGPRVPARAIAEVLTVRKVDVEFVEATMAAADA